MRFGDNGLKIWQLSVAGFMLIGGMILAEPSAEAAKAPKVVIAHLAEVEDIFDEETGELVETMYQYNVISVSENALKGHGNHEDVLDGEELADGTTFVADDYSRGEKIFIYVAVETEPEPAP